MTSEGNQILGRIYKIFSSETDKVYIGSTIRPLYERLSVHKEKYKLYLKGKQHFVSSFDIVKFNDACIVLLHEGLFDAKADLHRLEGQFMLETENCINRLIAGRDKKEYYKLHADDIKRYQVEYREQNRTTIQVQRKQYRLINKDMLAQRSKSFYEVNKDKVAQRDKLYRENNKDRIRERNTQAMECTICKSCIQKTEKARHERSKKHLHALSQASSIASPSSNSTSD